MKTLKGLFLMMAAAMLVGCAQIPMSSDVKEGPNMIGGLASDYLYYSPSGPSQGASEVEIINGFLNAGTGPQNDYAVAREFLSSNLAAKWNPNELTLVQTGRPVMVQSPNSSEYHLTANIVNEINADGIMNSAERTKNLTFHLIQEDGEWRIDRAPNLTLLIKPVFDVIFQSYSIYFFDQAKQYLVPDVRWFPSRASTGTRMINAMLKGPASWLTAAVSSAVPEGTKLNTAAVTVDGGIAVVDLSSRALKTTVYAKQLMRAQIYATLTQLPTVLDVNIQIDRSPQQIRAIDQPIRSAPSTTAFALVDSDIVTQGTVSSQPIAAFHDYVEQTAAFDFAATENQRLIALLGTRGLSVAFPGTRSAALKLVDKRQDLTTPEIDNHDLVWSMSMQAGHGIRVFKGHVTVGVFSPNWLHSLGNKRLAISPDGSRMLISGNRDGKSMLFVAGIARNSQGEPTQITRPMLLTTAISAGIEVNWVSDVDAVITQSSSTGSQAPQLIRVGGLASNLPAFSSSSRLAASADGQVIYLLSDTGELFTNRNQGWVFLRKNVRAVHFAH